MSTQQWLTIAKSLPVGQSTRIVCPAECGTDTSFSLNHSSDKYWGNCYRCGHKEYENKGYLTLAELNQIRRQNEQTEQETQVLALPSDISYNTAEWPIEARMWLYKASIYGQLITRYRIGYSPRWRRVVVPVYGNDQLVYFQARAVFKDSEPKYLNPRVSNRPIFFSNTTKDRSIVVCEDILSAIRVGEVTQACSILGTKVTPTVEGLLSRYDEVTIWLDPDQAGIEGARSLHRTCQLLGTKSRIINTDADPKEFTNQEIKDILCLS